MIIHVQYSKTVLGDIQAMLMAHDPEDYPTNMIFRPSLPFVIPSDTDIIKGLRNGSQSYLILTARTLQGIKDMVSEVIHRLEVALSVWRDLLLPENEVYNL